VWILSTMQSDVSIGKDVGHRREENMMRLAVSCAETVKSWGGVADAVDG
jgi:hypothetical protein